MKALWCTAARIAAALLLLSGCDRRETQVDLGSRMQVLHRGNRDEPSDMDPQINNAASTGVILGSLFQGLVTYTADGKGIAPGMAATWQTSGDGLTYTFHLRENAKWSNGAPLTSADFRESFMRIIDPKMGCEAAGVTFPVVGARDFLEGRTADPAAVGFRAPDAHTFVIVLSHPAPYLLSELTHDPFFPVYMPSLDANGGRRQRGGPWTRPRALVSNGPFTLDAWVPNGYVGVKRNPAFWDASRVRLREVRFYPTDDEDSEERAFRAGQLHVTARVPVTKVAVYEAGHPDELHLLPSLRTNYLTFNVARPPFTDARVRRAFSLAIDRERLVHAALGRLGTPAHSMVRPGTGGYRPPGLHGFDPVQARRLLADAGFPAGAGFPRVEFTLNGNSGSTLAVAEVLEQMWAKNLGVRVAVLPVEFRVYLSTLREKQFQVLLDGWSYLPDARDILSLGATGDPNNDAGYSGRSYDEALAASDRTAEAHARWRAFDAMEEIDSREVFYSPLYFTNQGILVHPDVHGWPDNGISAMDWRSVYLER